MSPIFRACLLLCFVLLPREALARDYCSEGDAKTRGGLYQDALATWAQEAGSDVPKERLWAVVTCLRHLKLATDDASVAQWMRARALEGVPLAQLFLGMMYASGFGVSQDYVLARKWLMQAISHGEKDAELLLNILDQSARTLSPPAS
ncbi:MAG: sel1 repeat family protein [Planctomyces sp.]|nr:sel1 repeat family protein [Planctomyces sp.]